MQKRHRLTSAHLTTTRKRRSDIANTSDPVQHGLLTLIVLVYNKQTEVLSLIMEMFFSSMRIRHLHDTICRKRLSFWRMCKLLLKLHSRSAASTTCRIVTTLTGLYGFDHVGRQTQEKKIYCTYQPTCIFPLNLRKLITIRLFIYVIPFTQHTTHFIFNIGFNLL